MSRTKQLIKVEELGSFNFESSLRLEVEGWIIGGSEIFLVDDCRNPVNRISLPPGTDDILIQNIPEHLRVGGEYIWKEKAVISGTMLKSPNGLEFLTLEKIVMPEIQKTILINKFDAL